jgi:hypothetical protein
MNKYARRLAVVAGTAALGTVALGAPAHAEENRGGGAVACAAGQAVQFSAVITDSFLSTKFTWVRTSGGEPRSYGQSSGRVVTYNTGEQSIVSWAAYTEADFATLDVSCAG